MIIIIKENRYDFNPLNLIFAHFVISCSGPCFFSTRHFSVLGMCLTGRLTAFEIGPCFITMLDNEVVVTDYLISYSLRPNAFTTVYLSLCILQVLPTFYYLVCGIEPPAP
jgi:hypothetical protein